MDFEFQVNQKGHIKKRESYNLEFKESFQKGDNLLKYLKTLVGMANNKGGLIIFGVKDKPHIPVGLKDSRFTEIDPKNIDSKVREYFEPSVCWNMKSIEYKGKIFGQLEVEEATKKPIVCKKNKDNILREGAIYFRYRGETKEIEYPELSSLLEDERKKERILWIKHIEKISLVGPHNIQLLDLQNGEITYGDSKILLDQEQISKLNVIKEGQFAEKNEDGVPVLNLVGSIEGSVDANNVIIDPNELYPFTTKQMQVELGLNQFQMQAVIYALKLKRWKKYHTYIQQGLKSGVHKYSQSSVNLIKSLFQKQGMENCLNKWIASYKNRNKGN